MSDSNDPSATPKGPKAPASAVIVGREESSAVKEAKDATQVVARQLDLSKTPEHKQPDESVLEQEFSELDFNTKLNLFFQSLPVESKMEILGSRMHGSKEEKEDPGKDPVKPNVLTELPPMRPMQGFLGSQIQNEIKTEPSTSKDGRTSTDVMSYPELPFSPPPGVSSSAGTQQKKNDSSWANKFDLSEIISTSPFLQLQNEDVLASLAGSQDYMDFKLLVAKHGSMAKQEVELLTMYTTAGTASSTPAGLLDSLINISTESRILQTSLKLDTLLGSQGENALKLIVEADRISKLGHYGIVCTLDHNPLAKIFWLLHSMYHAIPAVFVSDRLLLLHRAAIVTTAMHSKNAWLDHKQWSLVTDRVLMHALNRHDVHAKLLTYANLVDSTLSRHMVIRSQDYALASTLTAVETLAGGETLHKLFGLECNATRVARRLLTGLFDIRMVSTYQNNVEFPRNVKIKEFRSFSDILNALLAHGAELGALLGAFAMYHDLAQLPKTIVHGFAHIINSCTTPANDPSKTNPNGGTSAGLLAPLRQTDRTLGPHCLKELRQLLIAVDATNKSGQTAKLNALGENLHRGEVGMGATEANKLNSKENGDHPSGGAYRKNQKENVDKGVYVENRCVVCGRDGCTPGICDPRGDIKPQAGADKTVNPKRVCRNCGRHGHGGENCTENKAQGKILWGYRDAHTASLPPLRESDAFTAQVKNPYVKHAQSIQQPLAGSSGGVNMCYGQHLGHAAYGAYPQLQVPQLQVPQYPQVQALQNHMPSGMGVPPPPPNYLPMPTPPAAIPGWVQGMPSGGAQPTDVSQPSGGAQRAHFMMNGTGYAPSAGVPAADGLQVNGAWFSPIQGVGP